MLARARSFQVGNSWSSDSKAKGGNSWRSEKSNSPPSTKSKTNTWRRELSSSPSFNAEERKRESDLAISEKSSSPPSANTWRREANNKTEERRREADLARMKEEIVREVREEVLFTFTFSFFKENILKQLDRELKPSTNIGILYFRKVSNL